MTARHPNNPVRRNNGDAVFTLLMLTVSVTNNINNGNICATTQHDNKAKHISASVRLIVSYKHCGDVSKKMLLFFS